MWASNLIIILQHLVLRFVRVSLSSVPSRVSHYLITFIKQYYYLVHNSLKYSCWWFISEKAILNFAFKSLSHVAHMADRRGVYWVMMGKLEGMNHLEDPGIDGRIILRWIVRKWDVGTWTGSIWLRIGTGGGHLWMRLWAFGFHKIRGISWPAENPLLLKKDSTVWSK